ncbi:unnamed protein product [Auanema sp. JU1783]|nr:unnamed protein product [Auanema sp. JU1783]
MNYTFEVNDGKQNEIIEISHVTLLFLDTFHAELQRDCGNFSFFEYFDEDGDRISVKTDEDFAAFVESLRDDVSNRIWLVKNEVKDESIPIILPGDLENLGVINSGQFGTVYKSLHLPTDRIIAVKSLEVSDQSSDKSTVLREISVLKKCMPCNHIVELLGALMDFNVLMICLEFMDLGSIEDYLPLPLDVHQQSCKSVFKGLDHLWSNNIMHRDLKPANILVNTNGFIKISDFGVSKHVEHSVARTFVGTKAYMAPERLNGGVYKVESDIWSFGLTIWEMLLGEFPLKKFIDINVFEDFCKISSLQGTMLKPELPSEPALSLMIENCVCVDICSRWGQEQLKSCAYLEELEEVNINLLKAHFHQFAK